MITATHHVRAVLPRKREASIRPAATRRIIGAAMLTPVSYGPTAVGLQLGQAYYQYIYPVGRAEGIGITLLRADTIGHTT